MKMKKILCLAAFLFLSGAAMAQYAYRIVPVTALPASCNPANGSVVMLTTGVSGLYRCGPALNTWSLLGPGGASSQLVINQGTLTASAPFLTHTATWNNGAVTFVGFTSNTINTASAANSVLARWQIGGVDAFTFRADTGMTAGYFRAEAFGNFQFNTRSAITSSADGLITLVNAAASGFTRLNLGPVAVTHPGIAVSAPVAGQTQGIIITKADGTVAVFADLGAATNGSLIYCSDCTIASPCAGGGTGSLAKRLNGVWVCN